MSTTSKAHSPPVSIFLSITSGLFATIRPYTPRLVPLIVYAAFFPPVILVSLGAGYFVWSTLSVSWQVPLYLQYGDGVPPYANVDLPRLVLQQRYAVSVDLQLPATEMNLALGNFMTSLIVLSSKNNTLASIRRPAILLEPPPGWLFRKTRSIHMNVPLLESFVPTSSNLGATVQIGRADSWTTIGVGQGREVNIQFASLRGLVVPHGIRGLAVRFPLMSSVAASVTFFLVLTFMLAMYTLPLVASPQGEPVAHPQDSKLKKEKRRSTSMGNARSRRRSGSLHREDRSMVKTEPEITISLADEPSRILRRRSSRPSITTELDA